MTDEIARISAALRIGLRQLGSPGDPEAIADLLWLAAHARPPRLATRVDGVDGLRAVQPPSVALPQMVLPSPVAPRVQIDVIPPPRVVVPRSTEVPGVRSSVRIRAPGTLELRLPLLRSMVALRGRVPGGPGEDLDERATAQRVTEQRIWDPVMLPKRERAWCATVVLDAAPSMALWRARIRDAVGLLTQIGAFAAVRWMHLDEATGALRASAPPSLRLGLPNARTLPQRLRQITLVITDGLDRRWANGAAAHALCGLAANQPLAIVDLLPFRLWSRTPLGQQRAPVDTLLHRVQVVAPPFGDPPRAVAATMVELEPRALRGWARMHARGRGRWPSGVALGLVPQSGPLVIVRGDVAERFRASATPLARRLASLLALAPRVELPLARAVREACLPGAGFSEEVEVLLGGIFSVQQRDAARPDSVWLVMDPHAREVLSREILTTDLPAMFAALAAWLRTQPDAPAGLASVLLDPNPTVEVTLDPKDPLVAAFLDAMRTAGGRWRAVAERLAPSDVPDRMVAASAAPEPETKLDNDPVGVVSEVPTRAGPSEYTALLAILEVHAALLAVRARVQDAELTVSLEMVRSPELLVEHIRSLSSGPEDALGKMLRVMRAVARAQVCQIIRVLNGELEVVVSATDPTMRNSGYRRASWGGLIGRAARDGVVVWAPDLTLELTVVRNEPSIQSELVLPLNRERDVVGVVNLEMATVNALSQFQVQWLAALAGVLAPTVFVGIEPAQASPRSLWVVGSSSITLSDAELMGAEALGAALAQRRWELTTCGWPGVDFVVSRAYLETARGLGPGLVPPRVVSREAPEPYPGAVIDSDFPPEIDSRWIAIAGVDAVVVVGGRQRAAEISRHAALLGVPVMGVSGTGGLASRLAPEGDIGEPWDAVLSVLAALDAVETTPRPHLGSRSSLIRLATSFLAPQPLSTSDALASRIRRSRDVHLLDEGMCRLLVGSQRPAERVLGYIAVQAGEVLSIFEHLLLALGAELEFALETRETRPLWQGLVALDVVCRDAFVTSVDLLELLSRMEGRLAQDASVDPGGEVKLRLRGLVDRVRGTNQNLDWLLRAASDYERVRANQPRGSARTAVMNELRARVSGGAVDAGWPLDVLKDVFNRGDGGRVVALAAWAGRPDAAGIEMVLDAVSSSRTPFEQWTALHAALACVDRLGPAVSDGLVAEVLRQLTSESSYISLPSGDRSRRSLGRDIVERFAQRVGLVGAHDDVLGAWLLGHETRPRRLLLIGSDAEGQWSPQLLDLGERLARCGWRTLMGTSRGVSGNVRKGYERAGLGRAVEVDRVGAWVKGGIARTTGASCVLVVGGAHTTKLECEVAISEGLSVVAVPFFGGVARELSAATWKTLRDVGTPASLERVLMEEGDDPAYRVERMVSLVERLTVERDRSPIRWVAALGDGPDHTIGSATLHVRRGVSPSGATDAYCSTDEFGTPGQLQSMVFNALGLPGSVDASARRDLAQRGWAVVRGHGAVARVIVSIRGGVDTGTSLRSNLAASIRAGGHGPLIWIPLMGTGDGGLTPEDAARVIVETLAEHRDGLATGTHVVVSASGSVEGFDGIVRVVENVLRHFNRDRRLSAGQSRDDAASERGGPTAVAGPGPERGPVLVAHSRGDQPAPDPLFGRLARAVFGSRSGGSGADQSAPPRRETPVGPFDVQVTQPRAVDLRALWRIMGRETRSEDGTRTILISHAATLFPRDGRVLRSARRVGYEFQIRDARAHTVSVVPGAEGLDPVAVDGMLRLGFDLGGGAHVLEADAIGALQGPAPGLALAGCRVVVGGTERSDFAVEMASYSPVVASGLLAGGGAKWVMRRDPDQTTPRHVMLHTIVVPHDVRQLDCTVQVFVDEAGWLGSSLGVRHWDYDAHDFTVAIE